MDVKEWNSKSSDEIRLIGYDSNSPDFPELWKNGKPWITFNISQLALPPYSYRVPGSILSSVYFIYSTCVHMGFHQLPWFSSICQKHAIRWTGYAIVALNACMWFSVVEWCSFHLIQCSQDRLWTSDQDKAVDDTK